MLFSQHSVSVYYFSCRAFCSSIFSCRGTAEKTVCCCSPASLFYGWGEPRYLLVMLAAIVQGYVFGLLIEKSRGQAAGQGFIWRCRCC